MKDFSHIGNLLPLIVMGMFIVRVSGSGENDTLPDTCGSEDPSYNFTKSKNSPTNRKFTFPPISNPFPFLSLSKNSQVIAETYPIPVGGSKLQCHQTYYIAGGGGGTMTFRSQGYPSNTKENATSVTCFESPNGWKIRLTCEEFSVACGQGHVGISFNGDPQSSKEYCGNKFNSSLEAAWSNKLAVIFKTGGAGGNGPKSSKRFQCQIRVVPPQNEPISTTPPPAPDACECGQRNTNPLQGRIVNGTMAKPNEFPWRCYMDARRNGQNKGFCSCTLISRKWVMTAAHCVYYKDEAFIIFGDHEINHTSSHLTARTSRKLIIHPSYDNYKYGNDIALIELDEPITFTDKISPICLPWNMTADDFKGCTIVTSGWGYTSLSIDDGSSTLNKLNMKIITNQKCETAYDPESIYGDICAHAPGSTPFKGDSGSSMDLHRDGSYYAIGVAAWVEPDINGPTVFTRVTSFLDWIKSTTAGETLCGQ